jgi:NAD(P)H-quinone oxidoreductase subunit 4
MIGTGLTAVYLLILMSKAFFGRLSEQVTNLPRVYWSDRIPAIVLAVLIVVFGIQPNWLVRWTESTTNVMFNGQNPIVNVSFND